MDLIRNVSGQEMISLSSRIETGLGISGDDVDELLLLLNKRFPIDFTDFDYTAHFHEEGISLAQLPGFFLIRLPAFIAVLAIALLGFSTLVRQQNRAFWNAWHRCHWCPPKHDLQVGDLVVSAISGYFSLREDTRFIIV